MAIARRAFTVIAVLCAAPPAVLCAAAPAASAGATTARLNASFTPERLGTRATLDFGFSFSAPAGQVPPPLTQIALRYPANLGIALSGLGLQDCSPSALEAAGPAGCPPNSVMGYGEAFTGIMLDNTVISENAPISILRAPDRDGRLAVLFYAEGSAPVDTHVLFGGLLAPASSPFGGLVNIGVPLVPTLPGAPYISVIHLRATIGPVGVTYYEQTSNVTLAYKPLGILLPKRCPRGGFRFAARFGFLGGGTASAKAAIACPRRRR